MPTEQEQRELAIKRLKNKRSFWQGLVAYVVINAFLVGIWALSGGGYFWPGWVMAAWGIGVVFHAWSAFAEKPITEDDIQREMHRQGPAAA